MPDLVPAALTTPTALDDPLLGEPLLDNPVLAALSGPHAVLARWSGRAAAYDAEVCRFLALPSGAGPADWDALAELTGPRGTAVLFALDSAVPPTWEEVFAIDAVQLVSEELVPVADPEAVVLGVADVPEMLDLVERTRPGPFEPRTIEMGTYLGIRRDGVLVAMAGERMHLPGWTEISAVCTAPAFRGQGLGGRLVSAVAAGIERRGERAFLHTGADNTGAIRLYEQLGFACRRRLVIAGYRHAAP